jgi:3'-phosphoadenosine 5'-phosphosulfate sulfotransferase (PAPS reductase)/FAD synthetase
MSTEQFKMPFGRLGLIGPSPSDSLLKECHEIVRKAIVDTDPYAVCLMLSGGDDSVTALEVALMLGVKIDFIIHGVTGTGLPDVRRYVNKLATAKGITLLEADAGTAFEDYVRRKGFFGRGNDAHKFSYHILKVNPFNAAISKHIRQGKKGRKVILLNGVRVEESENRADNFGDNPYRWLNNNYWVNIIHWLTKVECLDILDDQKIERNPVSIALGRSGECNCGTMQSEADRMAASEFDPVWGEWMSSLRKEIIAKFGWDIGQNPQKDRLEAIKAEASKLSDYMPMCVGCKARQYKMFDI